MSIDLFIHDHDAAWTRLEVLSRQARRRRPQLSAAELDEFVSLYQQTSSHLSHARTNFDDPALIMRLTRIVADANGALHGSRGNAVRGFLHFFGFTFPAAVWGARWFVVIAALLTFVPAVVMGTWLGISDRAVDSVADEAAQQAYVTEDFEAYYSSEPAAQFSTEVLVNNIQVSFLAFALGIAFCVGTAYVLAFNGVNAGIAAGLFYNVGEPSLFWGLILPHGLLELSAVVIAGAAGLRLGWAVISPGDRRRTAAVAMEGRRSVAIIIGLALVFVVAGIIEGFVTPSSLSTPARVGVGVVAFVAFVLYVVNRGSRAHQLGLTGAWGERPIEPPDMAPTTDRSEPSRGLDTQVGVGEPG